MMKLKKHYQPTPVKWRKRGDAILYGCTLLIPVVMSAPLPDHYKAWINTILSVAGAAGKFVTNFFTEVPPEAPEINNANLN